MERFLANRRVLVVEDEMLILLMIEDMLADFGCEDVVTAGTVQNAIARIDAQRLDAAMLDMNLGGRDSQLVADALSLHAVPFVYSTGNAGQDIGNGYQGRPVLKKPFRESDLSTMLRALLED